MARQKEREIRNQEQEARSTKQEKEAISTSIPSTLVALWHRVSVLVESVTKPAAGYGYATCFRPAHMVCIVAGAAGDGHY